MDALPVDYAGSYPSVAKAPPARAPEFAFVGRSNVGKSSLINLLAGRKALAKTSGTPGKTQMLNHFAVDEMPPWTIVDLPGYGYARLSQKHRASLEKMIRGYLAERDGLHLVFVLLDAKIPLQRLDHEMITWLAERGIPQAWVFTKVDKGRSRDTEAQIAKNLRTLRAEWEELPPVFRTSSAKYRGRDDLLAFIRASLEPPT